MHTIRTKTKPKKKDSKRNKLRAQYNSLLNDTPHVNHNVHSEHYNIQKSNSPKKHEQPSEYEFIHENQRSFSGNTLPYYIVVHSITTVSNAPSVMGNASITVPKKLTVMYHKSEPPVEHIFKHKRKQYSIGRLEIQHDRRESQFQKIDFICNGGHTSTAWKCI